MKQKQDNTPCDKSKMVQEWFDEYNNEFEVLTWPPNSPDLKSNRVSVGCAGQTSQIHGGPTSQLTGLKGSSANILPQHTFRDLVESMP
ncbi:hypothetical protein QTP86_000653 [Hemibagrus guttatus]|nr:hypothetical protein QTP86_000653 [Hemibagrus guttatus]